MARSSAFARAGEEADALALEPLRDRVTPTPRWPCTRRCRHPRRRTSDLTPGAVLRVMRSAPTGRRRRRSSPAASCVVNAATGQSTGASATRSVRRTTTEPISAPMMPPAVELRRRSPNVHAVPAKMRSRRGRISPRTIDDHPDFQPSTDDGVVPDHARRWRRTEPQQTAKMALADVHCVTPLLQDDSTSPAAIHYPCARRRRSGSRPERWRRTDEPHPCGDGAADVHARPAPGHERRPFDLVRAGHLVRHEDRPGTGGAAAARSRSMSPTTTQLAGSTPSAAAASRTMPGAGLRHRHPSCGVWTGVDRVDGAEEALHLGVARHDVVGVDQPAPDGALVRDQPEPDAGVAQPIEGFRRAASARSRGSPL